MQRQYKKLRDEMAKCKKSRRRKWLEMNSEVSRNIAKKKSQKMIPYSTDGMQIQKIKKPTTFIDVNISKWKKVCKKLSLIMTKQNHITIEQINNDLMVGIRSVIYLFKGQKDKDNINLYYTNKTHRYSQNTPVQLHTTYTKAGMLYISLKFIPNYL